MTTTITGPVAHDRLTRRAAWVAAGFLAAGGLGVGIAAALDSDGTTDTGPARTVTSPAVVSGSAPAAGLPTTGDAAERWLDAEVRSHRAGLPADAAERWQD